MATQTKIPLTVRNPWWGHKPSDKQLKALWSYEECPDLFYGGGWGWVHFDTQAISKLVTPRGVAIRERSANGLRSRRVGTVKQNSTRSKGDSRPPTVYPPTGLGRIPCGQGSS